MIPEVTDKRWEAFLLNIEKYHFQLLSLKILMSRIKLVIKNDASIENIERCKHEVFDFFVKNEKISKLDLSQIFEKGTK